MSSSVLPRPQFEDRSGLAAAEARFLEAYPDFDPDGSLARLRRDEYGRLDAEGQVYLDYTGGGLHAASQIDAHAELLRTRVLGNPHSNSPTSRASTDLVERSRRAVLDFFGAPPDDYLCVFTANASAALRLVGESYRFAPGATLALSADNHNSVNGIREFARRAGAHVEYVPLVEPELRLDRPAMSATLARADRRAANLLAFPAQSNFSGVQHPLDLVDEAHDAGWDVLVDAAAFVPTNRLDVGRVRPDFAAMSFYKMFGFPTGVGCLLLRRDRVDRLRRPWFSGGTITIASVRGDGHYLHDDEAAFEDGTVDYLNLAAVATGLEHVARVGIDRIHERVVCLTGWLLDELAGLEHASGRPVVRVHGPLDTEARGGTVTFQVFDADGEQIDDRRVEELASAVGISLRTGCFCNPGAGEVANGLTGEQLAPWFHRDEPVSFLDLRERLLAELGVHVASIRVSVGIATTFADVHRFITFMQGFVDRRAEEIGGVEFVADNCRVVRDSA